MNESDSRYAQRSGERVTVNLRPRKLRVAGAPEETRALLPFGDVDLEVERDGDRVVIWVAGMPLLTGSLDEATRLTDMLRSIIGRP